MKVNIEDFLGKTFNSIELKNKEILLFNTDEHIYKMYHLRDCCESAHLEDIIGDLNDLIETPILQAEEVTSKDNPLSGSDYSFTWTFYKLATIKGYVTLR